MKFIKSMTFALSFFACFNLQSSDDNINTDITNIVSDITVDANVIVTELENYSGLLESEAIINEGAQAFQAEYTMLNVATFIPRICHALLICCVVKAPLALVNKIKNVFASAPEVAQVTEEIENIASEKIDELISDKNEITAIENDNK